MNHRINAILHTSPPCPECNAFASCPCTNAQGIVCAPHRVRERIASGELVVISLEDARAAKRVRALHELVGTIRGVDRR